MCLPAPSSPPRESCPVGGDTTTASPCWACQRSSLPLGACPGPTQPGTSQGKPVRFLGSGSGFYLPTGVSHPPSSAVLIIKMISGVITPFSSIFSCSKLGYRSTLSQIHMLSAQIFPPPHTFCSFQKQGRGTDQFFPGIGRKYLYSILPLRERRGGKNSYVSISNQEELGIIFCE